MTGRRESQETKGLAYYRGYGRDDVLYAGYAEQTTWDNFIEGAEGGGTTVEKLQAAYTQGKQEAEQRKQANLIRFYLEELIREMQEASEWYGSDFEKPVWIVQQAMASIEREKMSEEQTVTISGVMLRAQGNDAIVELEIGGVWYKIIACDMRGSFSHIVEPLGIQQCIETGIPKSS